MNLIEKMLKMSVVSMILLCNMIEVSAQSHKAERRIYLWDVSISMVGATGEPQFVGCEPPKDRVNPSYKYDEGFCWYNKAGDIFVATRDVMVESIRAIRDKNCEIVVIPYVATMQAPMVVKDATDESKEALISQIESWDNLKKGGNEGGTCLKQVLAQYGAGKYGDNKYNRIILLTDGHDYSENVLKKIIEEWEIENPGQYHGNRLVYAILSPKAYEKNADIVRIIDMKNADGNDHGVIYLPDLGDLKDYVNFSLGGYESDILLEDGFSQTMTLEVDCRINMGYEDAIKCVFSTGSSYVSVDTVSPITPRDGKFRVPIRFNLANREEYLNEIRRSGKKELPVTITCSVDPSCKSVSLEGKNEIKLFLSVDPQPKVIISISTK